MAISTETLAVVTPLSGSVDAVAAGEDAAVVAQDAVDPGAARDPVVTPAADEVIVAGVAEDDVVAGAGVHGVVARLAVDLVGAADVAGQGSGRPGARSGPPGV